MSRRKKGLSRSEERKMALVKQKERNRRMMMGIAVVGIVLVGGALYVSMGSPGRDETPRSFADSDVNEDSGSVVSIPLASIGTDAMFYSYESSGVDIHYFAIQGDDGRVHVAVDACDVCYHAKKGYEQQGTVMECRNCGLTFPIEDIGTKNTGGGCWPSYLPVLLEDDTVVIQKADLDNKRYMFA